MASVAGISFLYVFDLGNRNINNPGQNILSVTSTAAGDFDKSNMFKDSVRQVWRSNDVLATQEIIIQADLSSKIDTFAILGHNLTSGAIIQVQANISNNFVAPPVTITAVPEPNPDGNQSNIIIAQDFGAEYEFYKISILDPANPCGFIEIGRIIGGRSFILQNNENIVDQLQIRKNDQSEKMKTEGYFRQSNENIITRVFSSNFSKLDTTVGNDVNFLGLRALFKAMKTTRPFLMVLDRQDPTFLNMWGEFTKLPTESFAVNRFASFSITIEEVF